MTQTTAVLARAERLLTDRVEELAKRLEEGMDAPFAGGELGAWGEFIATVGALTAVVAQNRPEARGQLLTTKELAERLQVKPKTVLRRAKRGEMRAVLPGARGRGARWAAP